MTDLSPAKTRLPRMRVARGPKRPDYLGDRDLDRMMMMLTALMGEVSALRDRLDTHEQLGAQAAFASPAAIEGFTLSADDVARRAAEREAMLKRVFRVMLEELELAQRGDDGAAAGSEEERKAS